MPLALFGIDDGSLNLVVNLLILFLVVVWLALVWWTWTDARRRISDPVLVATATAVSLIPFFGTMVYSILRPPEFLEDAHERELEIRASELRLRQLTESSCPRCQHPIERNWLRCPECRAHLKDPCRSCNRPVDPRWAICPHCEAPVPKRERKPKEGRRRARPPAERVGAGRGEEGRRPERRRSESRQEKAEERPTEAKRRPPAKAPGKPRPTAGSGKDEGGGQGQREERPTRRRSTPTT
jgi:hypothetical protein